MAKFKVISPDDQTVYTVDAASQEEADSYVESYRNKASRGINLGFQAPGIPAPPARASEPENSSTNDIIRRGVQYGAAIAPGALSRSPVAAFLGGAGVAAQQAMGVPAPDVLSRDNATNVADAALNFIPGFGAVKSTVGALKGAGRSALRALTAGSVGDTVEGKLPGIQTGIDTVLGAGGGFVSGLGKGRAAVAPTLVSEGMRKEMSGLAGPLDTGAKISLKSGAATVEKLRNALGKTIEAEGSEYEDAVTKIGNSRTKDRMQAGKEFLSKKLDLDLLKGARAADKAETLTAFQEAETMRNFTQQRLQTVKKKIETKKMDLAALKATLDPKSPMYEPDAKITDIIPKIKKTEEQIQRLTDARGRSLEMFARHAAERDTLGHNLKGMVGDAGYSKALTQAQYDFQKAGESRKAINSVFQKYKDAKLAGEVSEEARKELVANAYQKTGFNVEKLNPEQRAFLTTVFKEAPAVSAEEFTSNIMKDPKKAEVAAAGFNSLFGRKSPEANALRASVMNSIQQNSLDDTGKNLDAKKFADQINALSPAALNEIFDNPNAAKTLKGLQMLATRANEIYTNSGGGSLESKIFAGGALTGAATSWAQSNQAESPNSRHTTAGIATGVAAALPILLLRKMPHIAEHALQKDGVFGKLIRDYATRPNEGTASRVLSYMTTSSDLIRPLAGRPRSGVLPIPDQPEEQKEGVPETQEPQEPQPPLK